MDDNKEYGLTVYQHEHRDIENPLPPLPPAASQCKKAATTKPAESCLSVILTLDQGLLTVYNRLLNLCLALNILGLVAATTGYFPDAEEKTAVFCIENILFSMLYRSEAFLRCIFRVTVKLLGKCSWVPLPLKTAATSFLHDVAHLLARPNTLPP